MVIQLPKNVTNIIGKPKYKYGQQEQVRVRNRNRSTALERSVLKYWDAYTRIGFTGPNLALSFCYMTKIVYNRNAKPNI